MRIPDISANRAFLSAVMKGAIPDELVHAAEGGEVHVDMEDHKEEEFVKPKVRQTQHSQCVAVLSILTDLGFIFLVL